ncbi:MAG: hypothetical protein J3R72DRAFT_498504 [Linnemannia gamsii]|nr:MAG: hypothetical protein J3R72DRAFT_498504 [Linnemannia gamsii]
MAIAPALAAAAQEESMNESAASMTEKHEKRFAKYTIGSHRSRAPNSSLTRRSNTYRISTARQENIKFLKQIIWLIGAPGSGKGIHTPAILRTRGITHSSISMPSLLTAPKYKKLINKGMLVSDGKLVENLWHALLDCEPEVGVLVDGFPHSEVQVECLKLFHERMHELRKEYKHTPIKVNFPRPTLQICVLHVDEEISINHQLMRRKLIKEHNAKVMRSGKGEVMEEHVTDFNEIPPEIFSKTVRFIDQEVSPVFARHSISGHALVRSDITILPDPKIVEVISSILRERGYAVTMNERVLETPKRVDSKAFEITLET